MTTDEFKRAIRAMPPLWPVLTRNAQGEVCQVGSAVVVNVAEDGRHWLPGEAPADVRVSPALLVEAAPVQAADPP